MVAPMPGPSYQGLSRTIQLPACVLSIDDLRRLFVDLNTLTREVTEEQIDALQLHAKSEAGLTMFVLGRNGEQIAIEAAAAITREVLPASLSNISLDAGARYKLR